ncbi:MAG: hypothetical protein HXX81_01315 [Campylobacterales bacterium]|nr:hypothetical protein [Campylobacterales bacterium]
MKIFIYLVILAFLLSGCYSKCGFSNRYYDDEVTYYDSQGNFHRECPEDSVKIPSPIHIYSNNPKHTIEPNRYGGY